MAYPEPTETRWIGLGDGPVPVLEAHRFLRDERCGAIAVFAGTTRRWTGPTETSTLHYEAYEPMARTELERLADVAGGRWALHRIVLLHRLGDVSVADESVLVGVASPHRDDAFAACRWLIDRLKAEVPIWKKEHDENSGRAEWVAPTGSTASSTN